MPDTAVVAFNAAFLFPCFRSGEQKGNSRGTALFTLSIRQTTSVYLTVPLFPKRTYTSRETSLCDFFLDSRKKHHKESPLYMCAVFRGTGEHHRNSLKKVTFCRIFTCSLNVSRPSPKPKNGEHQLETRLI